MWKLPCKNLILFKILLTAMYSFLSFSFFVVCSNFYLFYYPVYSFLLIKINHPFKKKRFMYFLMKHKIWKYSYCQVKLYNTFIIYLFYFAARYCKGITLPNIPTISVLNLRFMRDEAVEWRVLTGHQWGLWSFLHLYYCYVYIK